MDIHRFSAILTDWWMNGLGTVEGLFQPCIAWSYPRLRVRKGGIVGVLAPLLLMLSSPSVIGIVTRGII